MRLSRPSWPAICSNTARSREIVQARPRQPLRYAYTHVFAVRPVIGSYLQMLVDVMNLFFSTQINCCPASLSQVMGSRKRVHYSHMQSSISPRPRTIQTQNQRLPRNQQLRVTKPFCKRTQDFWRWQWAWMGSQNLALVTMFTVSTSLHKVAMSPVVGSEVPAEGWVIDCSPSLPGTMDYALRLLHWLRKHCVSHKLDRNLGECEHLSNNGNATFG